MNPSYVHGYQSRENNRLQEQAGALVELLHNDTLYPAGSKVLEVGCGIGAQTLILAQRSADAQFTSIDISVESITEAKKKTDAAGLTNVKFEQADIFALPYEPGSFDHIFVCFVLEHLSRPCKALSILKELIKTGGTITVIEGDHASTFFYPDSIAAHAAIASLVRVQEQAGGNALIGRQLYPLMFEAGFDEVRVSPRMVYVDGSRPDLIDAFTRKTFTAMIEGVRESAIAAGFIEPEQFDAGIKGLHRAAEPGSVFCYTFFKAVARRT
jgi:ubiquinone/menaquinone biosynthesis C-methylase UbiE